MKKISTLLATVFTLTIGLNALAQENTNTTEYKFDDDVVEGDLVSPDNEGVLVLKNENTKSLIKVRQQFIPEMLKSVEDI